MYLVTQTNVTNQAGWYHNPAAGQPPRKRLEQQIKWPSVRLSGSVLRTGGGHWKWTPIFGTNDLPLTCRPVAVSGIAIAISLLSDSTDGEEPARHDASDARGVVCGLPFSFSQPRTLMAASLSALE
jgi:hypothetical protein